MKKSTMYLYNIEAECFKDMSYCDAIELKISSAKKLIDDLVSVNHYARDDQRIKDILKAIKFNKDLLLEIDCD